MCARECKRNVQRRRHQDKPAGGVIPSSVLVLFTLSIRNATCSVAADLLDGGEAVEKPHV